MTKLSVIIITKNAAEQIEHCLQSIQFANEIIILDSGSEDKTVEICQQYTDNIMITDWQGFGIQKNRALAQARYDWVLSIDADEQVTPDLQIEILQAIAQTEYSAFYIPRISYYCGRWMQHSGWQPDLIIRLFKKECAHFTDDMIHEKLIVIKGKIGKLNGYLRHFSFTSVETVLEKINRYSSDSANMLYAKGKRANLTKAIFHGLWAFFKTYLLKRGFLDGQQGLMLAISNAEGSYYRYVKLMYLQGKIKPLD